MSIKDEACERYFQIAPGYSPFILEFENEGTAVKYRAFLNRWRKKNEDTLAPDALALVLRLYPKDAGALKGKFILEGSIPEVTFEEIFENKLAEIGEPLEVESALDLLLKDIAPGAVAGAEAGEKSHEK